MPRRAEPFAVARSALVRVALLTSTAFAEAKDVNNNIKHSVADAKQYFFFLFDLGSAGILPAPIVSCSNQSVCSRLALDMFEIPVFIAIVPQLARQI
jgi:hypothetical protein